MAWYLVSFSGKLERHADAARRELLKWGATNLWSDVWVVDMDQRPEACLPGFVETEGALAMPLLRADMFMSIGRAAGVDAQLTYAEKIAPQLLAAHDADASFADIRYCNDGQATFGAAVDHYLTTRGHSSWATDLCRLMAHHGSDKGIGWHTYTPFYQALFLDRREAVSAVFELGLGTNNEDTPSNMGQHGKPGASLRAWRDYFPNAEIYGADVDERVLFTEDRIQTFFVDQCDPDTFATLWLGLPDVKFDFFLDDGLHTFDAANVTFENSIDRVKSGGYYIIEDVIRDDVAMYLEMIARSGLAGMSIDITHPANIYDNCLVVAAIP